MPFAAQRAAVGLALVAACAPVDRAPPPPPPEATVLGSAQLGQIRCLLVTPFENTSDAPRLGEVATGALVQSIDPEQVRIFPIDDLRRLFRGTSLELPPEGVAPRLALGLSEKVKADGVLYGSVEGRAQGSATGFVVTVRLQSTAGHELLFAVATPVRVEPGESVEVALRRALLLAARPMLLKIGAPGERTCFDAEVVRRARVMRATAGSAGAAPGPEPAAPPPAAVAPAREAAPPPPPAPPQSPAPAGTSSPPPAPEPRAAGVTAAAASGPAKKSEPRSERQTELVRRLEGGQRFVLADVEFAGRTNVLSKQQGLTELAQALAAVPGASVRIEAFVDATKKPKQDASASMAQAMAVVRRLVALGVARERLEPIARGGEAPLVPNFTSKGRATNRRIEVVSATR